MGIIITVMVLTIWGSPLQMFHRFANLIWSCLCSKTTVIHTYRSLSLSLCKTSLQSLVSRFLVRNIIWMTAPLILWDLDKCNFPGFWGSPNLHFITHTHHQAIIMKPYGSLTVLCAYGNSYTIVYVQIMLSGILCVCSPVLPGAY